MSETKSKTQSLVETLVYLKKELEMVNDRIGEIREIKSIKMLEEELESLLNLVKGVDTGLAEIFRRVERVCYHCDGNADRDILYIELPSGVEEQINIRAYGDLETLWKDVVGRILGNPETYKRIIQLMRDFVEEVIGGEIDKLYNKLIEVEWMVKELEWKIRASEEKDSQENSQDC